VLQTRGSADLPARNAPAKDRHRQSRGDSDEYQAISPPPSPTQERSHLRCWVSLRAELVDLPVISMTVPTFPASLHRWWNSSSYVLVMTPILGDHVLSAEILDRVMEVIEVSNVGIGGMIAPHRLEKPGSKGVWISPFVALLTQELPVHRARTTWTQHHTRKLLTLSLALRRPQWGNRPDFNCFVHPFLRSPENADRTHPARSQSVSLAS
jgi:hypothetical protein